MTFIIPAKKIHYFEDGDNGGPVGAAGRVSTGKESERTAVQLSGGSAAEERNDLVVRLERPAKQAPAAESELPAKQPSVELETE